MSLCDSCYAPGQCCRDLSLFSEGHPVTVWADEDAAARLSEKIGAHWFVPVAASGEYVVPVDALEDAGRTYRTHRWGCRALGPDGRCTVYDDRPQLCRDFAPGSDPLCVHWQGAESGEESVL